MLKCFRFIFKGSLYPAGGASRILGGGVFSAGVVNLPNLIVAAVILEVSHPCDFSALLVFRHGMANHH